MLPKNIKAGHCYARTGTRGRTIRLVTLGLLFNDGHIEPARLSREVRYRQIGPNKKIRHGVCFLKSFARWAQEEVSQQEALKAQCIDYDTLRSE